MIDTGSSCSVIPVDPNSRDHPQDYLSAVNGSSVPTFGCKNITIDLGGPVPLNWEFCIAETLKSIIEMDFLSHFDIKIDPRRGRLIFPEHIPQSANIKSFCWFHRRFGLHAQKCRDPCSFLSNTKLKPSLCNVEPPVYNLGDYQFLEAEFPEVFSVSNLRFPPKHDIVHYIETTGPPIKERPRRLSPEKHAVSRKELSQPEELGIIRLSSSPWGSPIQMVKKSNGSWRVVGDYRRLNQVTVKDSYSIPFLHDFTENISGSTIFSSIDLFKSYHQIHIHPEYIAKTAICTPAGNWEFLKMSMGLTNAGQTFQRFMNSLFQDLSFVFVYIDDILIFSSSIEKHQAHLRQVFERLQRNGLIINAAKCLFSQNRLRFLGHIVSDKESPLLHVRLMP